LARLKARVELKENELKAAGLLATQERYAELEALKQQVQLAEAKLALDPVTSVTQQLERQTKHVDALRENSVAKRQLQAESELTELRLLAQCGQLIDAYSTIVTGAFASPSAFSPSWPGACSSAVSTAASWARAAAGVKRSAPPADSITKARRSRMSMSPSLSRKSEGDPA
jgi:hypothetical protein